MFRLTILSITGLVTGETEGSSLLQTSSRGNALASRAQNSAEIEDEDELDDALGGKKCSSWLADEAVTNAHDELEDYRQQMEKFDYTRKLKTSVKIGAYCPTIIANSNLTFAGSPCEDRKMTPGGLSSQFNGRENVLQECDKSLKDTCKFMKDAAKKMQGKVKQQLERWRNGMPVFTEANRECRKRFDLNHLDDLMTEARTDLSNMNCDYKRTNVFEDAQGNKKIQDLDLVMERWTNLDSVFQEFVEVLGNGLDVTTDVMLDASCKEEYWKPFQDMVSSFAGKN